jgi:hypothetical protein
VLTTRHKHKQLALNLSTSGGRSVGIIRLFAVSMFSYNCVGLLLCCNANVGANLALSGRADSSSAAASESNTRGEGLTDFGKVRTQLSYILNNFVTLSFPPLLLHFFSIPFMYIRYSSTSRVTMAG